MIKNKAFTIFELIIYMAIFSIFSVLSFSFLSNTYKNIYLQMKEDKYFIDNNIILDSLKRDLSCSKSELVYWDNYNFIFRIEDTNKKITDISWQFRKDGVFRIMGQYDFNKKRWLKKNVARVSFNFITFDYELIKSKYFNNVEFVNIVLDNKQRLSVELKNKYFML